MFVFNGEYAIQQAMGLYNCLLRKGFEVEFDVYDENQATVTTSIYPTSL